MIEYLMILDFNKSITFRCYYKSIFNFCKYAICMPTYLEAGGGHWMSCPIALTFIPFKQGLSLNLELG